MDRWRSKQNQTEVQPVSFIISSFFFKSAVKPALGVVFLLLGLLLGRPSVYAVKEQLGRESVVQTQPGAAPAHQVPPEFENVGINEKLGQFLSLETLVVNEAGESVSLRSFFNGNKPVVLSLVYYTCPGLCNLHLNGMFDTLKELDWRAGQEFEYLVLSFVDTEGPDLAAAKRASYMEYLERPGSTVHFLTASAGSIQRIASELGFDYKWVESSQEWAHASAAIFLTPKGKIARYLHGIMFDPGSFKLAINEAARGRVGSLIDRMVWYCFKYDPKTNQYTLYAFRLVQIGALLTVLVLAILLIPAWRQSRRASIAAGS
jgi:protein SCO1/2